MRSGLAAVAIMALVVAACGGGSDETAPSDPTPVAATSPVTTATPTSDVPTTSTTSAPTTTVDPTAALIAEIEADLNAGEQAFLAGAADPGSETSRTNLERYFGARALAILIDFYDTLVDEGLVARANRDVPSTILVLELEQSSSGASTSVVYCRIDAGVVVEILPDGSEAIVDDSITRYDTRTDVVLVDGVWVLQGGGEVLSERAEVQTCD